MADQSLKAGVTVLVTSKKYNLSDEATTVIWSVNEVVDGETIYQIHNADPKATALNWTPFLYCKKNELTFVRGIYKGSMFDTECEKQRQISTCRTINNSLQ